MGENIIFKQLRAAQWLLAHKKDIRKAKVIFLIILNAVFWGIAIWQGIIYFTLTKSHQEMLVELTKERIDWTSMHEHFKPQDIVISNETAILTLANGQESQYDFVVQAQNLNEKWMMSSIEYYFTFNGGQTLVKKSFILPDEKKYLFILGQKNASSEDVNFQISKINWQRIRHPREANLEILSKLIIHDPQLNLVMTSQGVEFPQISFTAENQSVYDFWEINFTIALYQNSRIVGINTIPLQYFKNEEKKIIELPWGKIAPQATSVDIRPEVNVLDLSVFMPPSF
ncbi:MAG: hypothetical protein PHE59_04310 [Patescibacteria group bacterium]|nr:hypothetical protein [Patescibacteria group bacterium]MDD5164215.1 hypothetical protein [Patescibacteria group bacterium]MDD5534633.1 hypothetical protein [Patescibacteria group bacterium]